jgi:flavin reductase (DIM6/NTAB) family NADH-FMN oxidoreductase RutF
VTTDAFDRWIAALDAPMVVVTTAAGGVRAGCMVGFHAQSSIEPRRLAVWLSKANHTYRVALHATHLAVHALTADDRDLAERFGGETGDALDKFAGLAWAPGPGGVPLLDALPHRTVVRRLTLLDDGGDHVLAVGEPVATGTGPPFRPLRLHDVADLRPGHEAGDADAGG